MKKDENHQEIRVVLFAHPLFPSCHHPNNARRTHPLTPMLEYVSLDPDSEAQVTELHRQRTLCGWASDYIPLWLDNVRKGDRVS